MYITKNNCDWNSLKPKEEYAYSHLKPTEEHTYSYLKPTEEHTYSHLKDHALKAQAAAASTMCA